MTANDPPRQQEAVKHGNAGLPGQSNRSNTQRTDRRFRRLPPEGAYAPFKFEERPKSGLIIPSCCEPHSSSPGGILPTFHLNTSNDRPACANGGVVAQTLPVRTSSREEGALVAGFAVLLFASGLALHSRNFACQLLETL